MVVASAVKVLLLTLEYPPNVYGGAGVHAKYLSQALAPLVELEVRTLDKGPPEVPRGIEVRAYPPLMAGGDGPMKVLETLSWNLNLLRDPIEADVIHCHTWYTDFAGVLARGLYGGKLVATVHSLEPLRPWKEEQIGRGYQVSTWMERTGLEACDAVIAVSSEMAHDIQRIYHIPREKITVIPNGVDDRKFRPVSNPDTLKEFGVRKPYILFVGRLTPQKGIFDLLQAARGLPKGLQVVCLTGKADTPEIEAQMAKEVQGHPNVHWIHRMVPEEQTVHLYTDCEAFVCPSIYEPFGIINLEAMACGRPVVATAVGGIKEVVVDGVTGRLVPPSDPRALTTAIEEVLGNPAKAAAMGREGRRRVEEHFTWAAVARRTVELYHHLLK